MEMNISYILSRGSLGIGSYLDRNRCALVFRGEEYTYSALNNKANQVANSLAEMGLRKGDRIAVLARNCVEWVLAFFGAAKVGAVIVPINIHARPREIHYIVLDSQSKYFIVDECFVSRVEEIKGQLEGIRRFIAVSEREIPGYLNFERLKSGSSIELSVDVSLDDLLMIGYTSGTTGLAKGVALSHGNRFWGVIANIDAYEITERDVYLCLPSLSWMAGFHHNFLATMYRGGTVVLMPSGGMDLEEVGRSIQKYGITMVFLVPTLIKQWLDRPELQRYDLRKVNHGHCGDNEEKRQSACDSYGWVLRLWR